jgi:NO-binding membrane sensor protein with MHYT domain
MFRVFTCLTGEHDLRLVLLAGMVCLVASIVAINIFHRAIASQTGMRFVWIAIAGAAIGYGIWATHFIAMLAYEPGISTGYGIVLTASSLAAAMLLTSGVLVLPPFILVGAARPLVTGSLAPASPACTISACGRSKCRAAPAPQGRFQTYPAMFHRRERTTKAG